MEIYCDRCEFRREYGVEEPLPRRCPECGWLDLWFEEDSEWNQLCELWALGNGWKGQLNSDPHLNSSLPQWYCQEGKLLGWEWFKVTLTGPENVGPPPVDQNDANEVKVITTFNYWFKRTGILRLWRRSFNNIRHLHSGRAGGKWVENLKIVQDVIGFEIDFDVVLSESEILVLLCKAHPMIPKLCERYMKYWEDRGLYHPPEIERRGQYS